MKSSHIGLLAGVVGAAAIGTFFGILYAPDKGKNTRSRLNYRLYRTRDRVNSLLDKINSTNESVFSKEAQEEGKKVIEEVRERTEDLRSEIDALISQIRTQK